MGLGAGATAAIGAGVSAAGSIGGALVQSGNAGKAGAQAQRNLQLLLPQMQQNYVNTLAGYQPYTEAGQQGLTASQDLLGLNGPDAAKTAMDRFQTSPGYQWSLDQGLRAVDAGAAAKGMLRSGATLKAEQTYGSGLADQEFTNYYNRLYNLAGQGLTAAGGVATANQNLIANEEGNATSQNTGITNAANAQNSITGNTLSGLGNTVNSLLQNKDFQSWIGGPSTPGNLSGYGATPSSYQTAPGFNIGTDINALSYWPGMPGGATYSG